MRIEEEIKQEKFKNEYQKLLVNILYTGHWIDRMTTRMLRPHGLSSQQLNVLRILRGQKGNPVSIKLIQERMLDKMSNASRLVDKLNAKGLVERSQSDIDRRQVKITITEQGLKLLTKVDKLLDNFEEKVRTISKQEAKELNDLLDKLRG